jgi:ABC-type sugar transport system ATPase subunit
MPDDRARKGICLEMRVRENVTLGILRKVFRRTPLGVARPRVERRVAALQLEQVGLDPSRRDSATGALSGGMQQRVLFAKTLAAEADVLVLDEPTQGVDIATKLELHRLIRETAESGRAIIVVSSELEELVALSDRVLCMREGRLTHELRGQGVTPSMIVQALWEHREPGEDVA